MQGERIKLTNTDGLVVCGGKSIRMGLDKGLLVYGEKAQRYLLYDIMRPFCDQVFLSCNKEQAGQVNPAYQKLVDADPYIGIGPMAAILTAMDYRPNRHLLVLASDYPYLKAETIKDFCTFIASQQSKTMEKAIAFSRSEGGIYEPLLAWYPATCKSPLRESHAEGNHSLQYFLKQSNALGYHPADMEEITSVDTPTAYDQAKEKLTNKK